MKKNRIVISVIMLTCSLYPMEDFMKQWEQCKQYVFSFFDPGKPQKDELIPITDKNNQIVMYGRHVPSIRARLSEYQFFKPTIKRSIKKNIDYAHYLLGKVIIEFPVYYTGPLTHFEITIVAISPYDTLKMYCVFQQFLNYLKTLYPKLDITKAHTALEKEQELLIGKIKLLPYYPEPTREEFVELYQSLFELQSKL